LTRHQPSPAAVLTQQRAFETDNLITLFCEAYSNCLGKTATQQDWIYDHIEIASCLPLAKRWPESLDPTNLAF